MHPGKVDANPKDQEKPAPIPHPPRGIACQRDGKGDDKNQGLDQRQPDRGLFEQKGQVRLKRRVHQRTGLIGPVARPWMN